MTDPKPRLPLIGGVPLGLQPDSRPIDASAPLPIDTHPSGLRWARRYRTRLRVTDICIVIAAVLLALFVRFGALHIPASVGALQPRYWAVSALIVITWVLALAAFHTRDSRVVGVGATEYKQVVTASMVAFGLLAITFLALQVDIIRGHFVLALPLGIAGLVLSRWLWRKWLLHQRVFGHYLARVIVVGDRDDVAYVVRQIDLKSGAAYDVVGAALEPGDAAAVAASGHVVPVVSDLDHVAQAATSLSVDTVIVAGQPTGGSQFIRNLGWNLESTSAELVLSSRLTDVAGPRIHFRPVEGLPLIHVEIPHFDGAKHVLKRTLDVGASALSLVVLAPVLIAIGLFIKLDSPGPMLFSQQRCGRNGDSFRMLKFRSMVQTAEDDLAGLQGQNQASGLLFKIRNDPRVTRVGRFIRKYSLDELPQLWNVLVGEMSLVGPRPPLPQEVERYESHVRRRLYIKPGLTGMWQINGRSNLSWEDSVRLDLYYVENWSLTGDLMIIWRTFKTVIKPAGAY
ncbi:sugar transferase [Glaciibacter superstes]|uniref:sugar transferase n=1 Tax=Glaciibacter superstes TaxID=501023 RepID=UPI0003B510D5|nr:sugar transferase [Glaciibacter superstes]